MKYIRRTNKEIKENFVEELLLDRGIITQNEDFLKAFFKPTKDNEIDPSLLENIDAGYQLLMKHLKAGHKIYLPVD